MEIAVPETAFHVNAIGSLNGSKMEYYFDPKAKTDLNLPNDVRVVKLLRPTRVPKRVVADLFGGEGCANLLHPRGHVVLEGGHRHGSTFTRKRLIQIESEQRKGGVGTSGLVQRHDLCVPID